MFKYVNYLQFEKINLICITCGIINVSRDVQLVVYLFEHVMPTL